MISKYFSSTQWQVYWPYLLVFIAALVPYLNTLGHQFVWDDQYFILDWTQIKDLGLGDILSGRVFISHSGVFRPMRNLIYYFSYFVWGLEPWGYHLQAIMVHSIISVLLYGMLYSLTQLPRVSLVAALIFAVHPLHVETVAWVTSSYDLFSYIFGLLAAWSWSRSYQKDQNQSSSKWHLCCWSLAFLSYEIALMLPLILVSWLLIVKKESLSKVWYWLRMPFSLMLAYVLLRLVVLGSFSRMPVLLGDWGQALLFIPRLLSQYWYLFFWPIELSINHYFLAEIPSLFWLDGGLQIKMPEISLIQFSIFLSWTVMLILLYVTWLGRKRWPMVSWSVTWAFIGLIPVSQIWPQPIIFAENYAYLASGGMSLLVALILEQVYSSKWFRIWWLGLSVYLLSLTGRTWVRNQVWANDLSLWRQAASQQPSSPAILNSLGAAYANQGNRQKSIELFQRTLALSNQSSVYCLNLATQLRLDKQLASAEERYLDCIADHPQEARAYQGLIELYRQQSKWEEMAAIEARWRQQVNSSETQ